MKGVFNFAKIGEDHYLVTNYAGRYCFLSEQEFFSLCQGENLTEPAKTVLTSNFFVTEEDSETYLAKYSEAIRHYRDYLFSGTGLHIFVLTSQCNLKCVYCQASTMPRGKAMSLEIAEKCVKMALQSPNRYLSFEFQGGEPLMNFSALRHIVLFAEKQAGDKIISFNLVSNLTLLTDEMIDFITEHHINVSTSLDGDRCLHNKNRPYPQHDSFGVWEQKYEQLLKALGHGIGAIQTTTRHTFGQHKKLVDQYIASGFTRIFIRPLTPLGYAASRWSEIGYTAEEFLEFYRDVILYLLEKEKQGIHLAEGHAAIFLDKILNHRAGNYTELTSPCGAALGQLAYNYDGKIYTCDEGRMLAEMGDESFQVGTVGSKYEDLFSSPVCKSMVNASCLESIPQCADCVYSPYCGTCPVLTYSESKSIFASEPNGYKCRIYKGMLDILFEILYRNDSEEVAILKSWT